MIYFLIMSLVVLIVGCAVALGDGSRATITTGVSVADVVDVSASMPERKK